MIHRDHQTKYDNADRKIGGSEEQLQYTLISLNVHTTTPPILHHILHTPPSTTMSSNPIPANASSMPDVQVFLSRQAYFLGSPVVGTIVIQSSRSPSSSSSASASASSASTATREDLRETLKSVVVYMAGFCRIDPRWHNVADYTRLYGTMHPFLELLDFDADLLSPPSPDETVCVWATNGMELLTIKERENGKALDEKDYNLLAFSFRADLGMDLPHSMSSTTGRYHYTADVLIQTATQQRVIKTPFQVYANPEQSPLRIPRSLQQQQQPQKTPPINTHHKKAIAGSRVKFGSMFAMAHSNGWPCHLSATDIHRPKGQTTVARRRPVDDVQTLRVSNSEGQSVCVLTVIDGTTMMPGSQIHLQWDFLEDVQVPCYQVAACLMGDEWAVHEDGSTTRTHSYLFHTCHEWVDPGITQRVSKSMILPLDTPCEICTDVMEISVRCQVDITVQENNEYKNLHLELPCRVVQRLEDKTKKQLLDDDEELQSMSLSELLGIPPDPDFPQNDIGADLKALALMMEGRLCQGKR